MAYDRNRPLAQLLWMWLWEWWWWRRWIIMHKTVGTFSILSTKVSSRIIYKRNFGHFCKMSRLVLSRMDCC